MSLRSLPTLDQIGGPWRRKDVRPTYSCLAIELLCMLQDTTLAKILSVSKILVYMKLSYFLITLTFYAYFVTVCVINQCKIVTGMPENIATTRNDAWELAERSQCSA
jgi:hypothetical protein